MGIIQYYFQTNSLFSTLKAALLLTLNNTPDNRTAAKKPDQNNNIEIFDKDNVESEGIDFGGMEGEDLINKPEQMQLAD